ncbi:MAG: c-type cytochrome [Pseudomonadota bacterium]
MRALALTLSVLAAPLAAQDAYSEADIAEIAAEAGLAAAPLMLAGDVDYGEYLSGNCTSCHQTSGANDGIPGIVGWDAVFFKLAMHEYKQKRRDNAVMQLVAGSLGDEEIAALAAYFETLPNE